MAKRKDYEGYRKRQAKISRDRSDSGRRIKKEEITGQPKDKPRHDRGRADLEAFCREYFPHRFYLPFSPAHRKAIGALQECTESGGQFVCAMPRGFGKDTIAECEALRALLYGLRRYLVYITATQSLALRTLKKLRAELETNPLLHDDFDQVTVPIRKLDRNTVRARMQTYGDEGQDKPTFMEWTADGVVLPTVEGSAASGAAIHVAGLTGAIRGLTVLGPDGKPHRPDMVIVSDAQTRESAKSPTQTADREAIITDDVLMLAGPTTKIAAAVLCTVIYRGDLSDRLLDPERHPEWKAVCARTIERFPDDMAAWDEYAEIRRESLREDGGKRSLGYLREHFDAMHAGAVLSWPERVKDGDLSALQSAMDVYYDNPRGFHAELQNDPQADAVAEGSKELHAESVAARLSGLDRLAVPRESTRLTAFIDPGLSVLWYAVVAWNDRGGGSVVDYGCYPRQNRSWFEARDARPSLANQFPGRTEPQLVFAGLSALAPEILNRVYYREGPGDELKVERCLVDCGWQQAAVFQWVRASDFAATVFPSKGIGRTQTARGVAEWKRRPGERSGWHWRLTIPESGKVRMVQFDPDQWKTRLHGLLTVPLGGPTGLTLFGKRVADHEMIGAHCAAEYSSPVTIRGETFDKWEVRPDRPDNHLLDCLVGAAVAAAVAGVQWSAREQGEPEPAAAKPKPKTYAETMAQRQSAGPTTSSRPTYAEVMRRREQERRG